MHASVEVTITSTLTRTLSKNTRHKGQIPFSLSTVRFLLTDFYLYSIEINIEEVDICCVVKCGKWYLIVDEDFEYTE